ncbi:hypothetical protein HK405_003076 [Cladochytrium tenue]|nr:hypothetical protein HK405_003076 [Cladochytrium tenue]
MQPPDPTSDSTHIDSPTNDSESDQLLLSLRVCRLCQDQLLQAFEHCLSRRAAAAPLPNLESVLLIDEVADATPLTEPPHFQVVRDPTTAQGGASAAAAAGCTTGPSRLVEKDRTLFQADLQARAALDPRSIKAPTIGQPKGFSGALHKRAIEARDREIRALRDCLYDRTTAERREHQNVAKLKAALAKSVVYCSYAEEWQALESSRLQQDVRYLKAELSSLMAFLINSEEEKRLLKVESEALRSTVQEREARIAEVESQRDDFKSKLHDSYRDYLAVNAKIDALKLEAERGSDDIVARNEVLQRNLDAIARDFERASRELAAATTRAKELEFELEETVAQFNLTGEAKRSSEELNVKLTAERDALQKELTSVKAEYEESTQRADRLDKELTHLLLVHQQQISDSDQQIEELNKELATSAFEKRDVEANLRSSRVEVERLSASLKSVTRARDQLEAVIRSTAQKHEAEVTRLEEKIKDLQSMRLGDERVIRRLNEQKEQLMFQVTDLQNNLDRETTNGSMLSFELVQLRRSTEEKTTNLEEQVEKLNAAKVNLANDKRQLTDKLRVVRADLQHAEDQIAATRNDFASARAAAAAKETELSSNLEKLNGDYRALSDAHTALESKEVHLRETNVELMVRIGALEKQQEVLQSDLDQASADRDAARAEVSRLEVDCADAVRDRADAQLHLEAVTARAAELTELLARERAEAAARQRADSEALRATSADLDRANADLRDLSELRVTLSARVTALETELSDVRAALAAESENRRLFEARLVTVRSDLLSERRSRLDVERLRLRLDRSSSVRDLDRLAALQRRARRFDLLASSLSEESSRLSGFAHLLPSPDTSPAFNVGPDVPDLPDFVPPSPHTHPRRRDELHPDMRVSVIPVRTDA